MFCIEVEEKVTHTAKISDENEKKIKDYIKENPEEFEFMSSEDQIIRAISILFDECKLNLYESTIESDSTTEDIQWSTFEERKAEDILKE